MKHAYIHIPFCHRICPYCAFYKHTPGGTDIGRFVKALLLELSNAVEKFDLSIETLYIGGGTPSAMSRTHLSELFEGLQNQLPIAELQEFSLESNPATFGEEKAALFRSGGVTRMSLGVQSFHPKTLHTLGRDHSPEQAAEAFQVLQGAGFKNLSLDLMFAIPGQPLAAWEQTLQQAIDLKPDHISAYNLNYEEDTEFFEKLRKGEFIENPDEDADFFSRGIEILTDAGFEHYEISNYARSGHQSVHNQSYWAGADYLGIGPGAVSTINGTRWKNLPDTAGWMQRLEQGNEIRTEIETLTPEMLRLERIALQLRTARGLSREIINDPQRIEDLCEEGLLEAFESNVRLTSKGKVIADSVTAHLV